jgi:bis(5'-nucleosyl)-tetraphosphatase (symmetrical)
MPIAIGDIQGCNSNLEALLSLADPGAKNPLWFAGDLVNRGPDSLAVLRRVAAMSDRAVTVLGNHDLHLLATSVSVRRSRPDDTIDPVLIAPDRDVLLDWLRRRPLAHFADAHLLVHAGVFPQWSAGEAVALADEVERVLRGPDWIDFLRVMYGNQPDRWEDTLSGDDRLRAIVNAFTRIRYVDREGRMDFDVKEGAAAAPPGLVPWFDAPDRRTTNVTVVFGHWSTLGLVMRPNLIALDTGCVWGGSLTAVRLQDRRVYQVSCPQARVPRFG